MGINNSFSLILIYLYFPLMNQETKKVPGRNLEHIFIGFVLELCWHIRSNVR